mgnify:CR=1 FL=1
MVDTPKNIQYIEIQDKEIIIYFQKGKYSNWRAYGKHWDKLPNIKFNDNTRSFMLPRSDLKVKWGRKVQLKSEKIYQNVKYLLN